MSRIDTRTGERSPIAVAVRLMIGIGLRESETITARWEWFDWDRAKPDDKNAKIAVNPDGDRRAIRNWLERNAAKDNPTEITRLNFLGEMGFVAGGVDAGVRSSCGVDFGTGERSERRGCSWCDHYAF